LFFNLKAEVLEFEPQGGSTHSAFAPHTRAGAARCMRGGRYRARAARRGGAGAWPAELGLEP
jgi:hypothetical protein